MGGPTRDQGSADHTVFAPHAGSPDGASPGTGQPWLRLDDGSRIDLGTAVVLGREPVAPPDVPTATPHAVVDPTMRLSKTHVAMGRNPDGVWVLDLYSTNGVRVAHPGADVTAVTPGQSTPVPVGSRIEFGGRSLEVCDG
ncbi:MAG TPA: FHA domain-containing protein [Propionibacterium sp.]|nr:FHA domain-containing protein [Propionibacterium sp.]